MAIFGLSYERLIHSLLLHQNRILAQKLRSEILARKELWGRRVG